MIGLSLEPDQDSFAPRGTIGILFLLLCLCFALCQPPSARAGWRDRVRQLAGPVGVLVEDPSGKALFGHNEDKDLVPASILKIVTATAALSGLGEKYRFSTTFRLTPKEDLIISGRGDPLLISEEVATITDRLKGTGLTRVRQLIMDDSFFTPGLVLDGTARSLNPYDAFNGALNVNFNTINVIIGRDGTVRTAEPQTPLTPLAQKMARQSGARGKVRLNLSESPELCLRYAGEIFKAFLTRAGVEVSGGIRPLGSEKPKGRQILLHNSSFTLVQVVSGMMEFSNNFMANQVFLTLGAEKQGPPATVEKARRTVAGILAGRGLAGLNLAEGSGLSRKTRLSPRKMVQALELFRPHAGLLKSYGPHRYKTGTLKGVQSLAGYLDRGRKEPAAFAIILNGDKAIPGKREQILNLLHQGLTSKNGK